MGDKSVRTKRHIEKRFIGIYLMIFSFVGLVPSGIMLHFLTSEVYGHFLMTVHNLSAVIFLISVVYHISHHWRHIVSRAVSHSSRNKVIRKGFVVAAMIAVLILVSGMMHVFCLDL